MISDDWSMVEVGWYENFRLKVAVLRNKSGKKLTTIRWESIATDEDDKTGGPMFRTMKEAMEDAEKRAEK